MRNSSNQKTRSLEQTWILFVHGCLFTEWVRFGDGFWCRCVLLFYYYLPLEKVGALYLNKLEFQSPWDYLCQVWLKVASWFCRKKQKCEKFTDRPTDRQTTDDKLSEKLTWAFSPGELKIFTNCSLECWFYSYLRYSMLMSIFCIKFKTSWMSIILISPQLVNWILKMIFSIFKIFRSL